MTDAQPRTPRTVLPAGSPPPPAGPHPLLIEGFDRDRVAVLRHAVAAHARSVGLAGQRLDDFVLAVNELITNAVRHGGGQGWLRLWREPGAVWCEVSDGGPGISPARLGDQTRPAPDAVGGWGLWLIRRLTDDMLVSTGPTGTSVRISTAVADTEPDPPTTAEPAPPQ